MRLTRSVIEAIDGWAERLGREAAPRLRDRADLIRVGELHVWVEYMRLARRGTVKGRRAPATTDMLRRWLKRRARLFPPPSTFVVRGAR